MAKEPTFLQGLFGSAIPLIVAIIVGVVTTALYYTFWFGIDWLSNLLF